MAVVGYELCGMQAQTIGLLICAAIIGRNARGQATCDQLDVISLRYAPFSDTSMQVTAHALPGTLFTSPYFNLYDVAGDTVAAGSPWFFGMTSVPQSHTLLLDQGDAPPPTPFNGTLEFNFMTIDGPVQCLFDMTDIDLCSIASCETVNPFAYRTGAGDPVTTALDWHLTDDVGATIASGVFNLDALDQQIDHAEVCAAPGNYTLHVSQAVAVGSSFAFGVTLGGEYFTVNGPIEELSPGGQASVDFMFYPTCIDGGQSMVERPATKFDLLLQGQALIVKAQDDQRIGPLRITDGMGRVVVENTFNSTSAHIDLSRASAGVYLVQGASLVQAGQRFIIP